MNSALPAPVEVDVRPAWPYRLPARGGMDGVMRVDRGVASRFLHVDDRPVLVRAWQPAAHSVRFRAEALPLGCVERKSLVGVRVAEEPAGAVQLEEAIDRMRFALAVDDDLTEFAETFRGDPLLGPLIKRNPWFRPRRRPWPWEALAWAVTEQLIESTRAGEIQRRIVRGWGPLARIGNGFLRDVPCAATMAGRAPAELEGMDLAGRRAIALRAVAREIAEERCDPAFPEADAHLMKISNIGPWTVQVLGLNGRGEADSLPAGDLAYIKLVGHLAGLGRRATVEEVEEFYAPYAPFRGLAGLFTLSGLHKIVAQGPPLPFVHAA